MKLDDIKAGKYQLVAIRWDEITSEPGKPLEFVRHRRGDIVDLSETDARRLFEAGAIVKPGQLAKAAAEEARAIAERAAAEYQAILAGLPEDVRAEIDPGTVAATGEPEAPAVPTRGSSTADWVAYATDEARGDDRLTLDDAEALKRDELADRFLGPKDAS